MKSDLKKHQKQHQQRSSVKREMIPSPVRCEICDKVFANQYNLNGHMLVHKETLRRCVICDRDIAGQNLKKHLRRGCRKFDQKKLMNKLGNIYPDKIVNKLCRLKYKNLKKCTSFQI